MPRHRRLNVPGEIHHVITRGLNRQDIFLDGCDRNDFLGQLEKNLSLTACRCCLSAQVIDSLGDLMRKVLTGYAISLTVGMGGTVISTRTATPVK